MSSMSKGLAAIAVSITLGLLSPEIAQAGPGHSRPHGGGGMMSL